MDKDIAEILDRAGIALAYKPPKPEEIEFKMPEVIEPVQVEMSGQEKRRERRKNEKRKKKYPIVPKRVVTIDANVLEELLRQVGLSQPEYLGNGLYKLPEGAIVGEDLMRFIYEMKIAKGND